MAAAEDTRDAAAGTGLGVDIRALRKARGLTLADLAERVGRSPAWLSQVERGLSEPSIGDLRRLATAFGVTLSFFFAHDEDAPAAERGRIVRADRRRSLGDKADGLTEELLSPDLAGDFLAVRSEFAPGTSGAPSPRYTEELGYLVSGRLELWIGESKYEIGPGDSFRIRGERCRWHNPGDEPAVAVWIISPPVY